MLIGVGFAAGQRQGVLLAVALTGCTVALGLATASDLSRAGASRVHAAALTAGLGSSRGSGRWAGRCSPVN
jgi:ZIP family zinc transporter